MWMVRLDVFAEIRSTRHTYTIQCQDKGSPAVDVCIEHSLIDKDCYGTLVTVSSTDSNTLKLALEQLGLKSSASARNAAEEARRLWFDRMPGKKEVPAYPGDDPSNTHIVHSQPAPPGWFYSDRSCDFKLPRTHIGQQLGSATPDSVPQSAVSSVLLDVACQMCIDCKEYVGNGGSCAYCGCFKQHHQMFESYVNDVVPKSRDSRGIVRGRCFECHACRYYQAPPRPDQVATSSSYQAGQSQCQQCFHPAVRHQPRAILGRFLSQAIESKFELPSDTLQDLAMMARQHLSYRLSDMIKAVKRVYRSLEILYHSHSNPLSITAEFKRYNARWYVSADCPMLEFTFRHENKSRMMQELIVESGAENVLRANVAIANRASKIAARFQVSKHPAGQGALLTYQVLLPLVSNYEQTVVAMMSTALRMKALWEHLVSIACDPSPSLERSKQTTCALLSQIQPPELLLAVSTTQVSATEAANWAMKRLMQRSRNRVADWKERPAVHHRFTARVPNVAGEQLANLKGILHKRARGNVSTQQIVSNYYEFSPYPALVFVPHGGWLSFSMISEGYKSQSAAACEGCWTLCQFKANGEQGVFDYYKLEGEQQILDALHGYRNAADQATNMWQLRLRVFAEITSMRHTWTIQIEEEDKEPLAVDVCIEFSRIDKGCEGTLVTVSATDTNTLEVALEQLGLEPSASARNAPEEACRKQFDDANYKYAKSRRSDDTGKWEPAYLGDDPKNTCIFYSHWTPAWIHTTRGIGNIRSLLELAIDYIHRDPFLMYQHRGALAQFGLVGKRTHTYTPFTLSSSGFSPVNQMT
eukprot:TRINITY_DN5873_c0_g1_i3.p1 TRINITY_DN5873_c0_g1~~TRINITY_DN5873_c0_g1_i3.p1  ORF type:complete len:917 (-),score=103.83 TRINITY_DN5873_c0_g1_i3:75-2513(-)